MYADCDASYSPHPSSFYGSRTLLVLICLSFTSISLILLTLSVCSVTLRPASVERKPPELSTLNDGYQIRIWPPTTFRTGTYHLVWDSLTAGFVLTGDAKQKELTRHRSFSGLTRRNDIKTETAVNASWWMLEGLSSEFCKLHLEHHIEGLWFWNNSKLQDAEFWWENQERELGCGGVSQREDVRGEEGDRRESSYQMILIIKVCEIMTHN